MSSADGMNYAPRGKAEPVCEECEFRFAAIGLDHGHVFGMSTCLADAGAEAAAVYDRDPAKVQAFSRLFPGARVARCEAEILEDRSIQMVASAAITAERGPLGLRVLDHGKHYFSDKAPFTTLEQLKKARAKVAEAKLKWAVCYSERVQNEAAVFAGQLIDAGAVGRVLQVMGTGPHRLDAPSRPGWFFRRASYGGILCDIGSHQVEQFLHFANVESARVVHSQVANFNHPQHPELEDFGDAVLVGDNGATNYFRVDWFTPDGLDVWGDGRTFILGTEGYIELRKYIDLGHSLVGNQVYLVNGEGTRHYSAEGQTGFPYFGELILDCLESSEKAMTQEHTFLAAQLSLQAQARAARIK